nr:SDR family oxidoreductase [Salinibacterium sp. ZJ454]
MPRRLEGQTAYITGAAAGIGAATAGLFAAEGARVLLVDRDAAGVVALADELNRNGHAVTAGVVDVTDPDAVRQSMEELISGGPLDILFNCAGGSTAADSTVDNVSEALWESTFRLELESVAHCSRWALPALRRSGGGSIVNMSSFVAYRGTVRAHAYASAKGAVSALTRSMAGAYATEGIRVNAIAPGVALTERVRSRLLDANVADHLSFAWKDYPFAVGDPEDIASVALFLASRESRMITGQTIFADGGLTAY